MLDFVVVPAFVPVSCVLIVGDWISSCFVCSVGATDSVATIVVLSGDGAVSGDFNASNASSEGKVSTNNVKMADFYFFPEN